MKYQEKNINKKLSRASKEKENKNRNYNALEVIITRDFLKKRHALQPKLEKYSDHYYDNPCGTKNIPKMIIHKKLP